MKNKTLIKGSQGLTGGAFLMPVNFRGQHTRRFKTDLVQMWLLYAARYTQVEIHEMFKNRYCLPKVAAMIRCDPKARKRGSDSPHQLSMTAMHRELKELRQAKSTQASRLRKVS